VASTKGEIRVRWWELGVAAMVLLMPIALAIAGDGAAGDGAAGDGAAGDVGAAAGAAAAGAIAPEPKSPQPYIFWAYGLTCLLLFFFSLWTVTQSRRNAERIARLRERFDAATGKKSDVR
jgi:hypothetical protein